MDLFLQLFVKRLVLLWKPIICKVNVWHSGRQVNKRLQKIEVVKIMKLGRVFYDHYCTYLRYVMLPVEVGLRTYNTLFAYFRQIEQKVCFVITTFDIFQLLKCKKRETGWEEAERQNFNMLKEYLAYYFYPGLYFSRWNLRGRWFSPRPWPSF